MATAGRSQKALITGWVFLGTGVVLLIFSFFLKPYYSCRRSNLATVVDGARPALSSGGDECSGKAQSNVIGGFIGLVAFGSVGAFLLFIIRPRIKDAERASASVAKAVEQTLGLSTDQEDLRVATKAISEVMGRKVTADWVSVAPDESAPTIAEFHYLEEGGRLTRRGSLINTGLTGKVRMYRLGPLLRRVYRAKSEESVWRLRGDRDVIATIESRGIRAWLATLPNGIRIYVAGGRALCTLPAGITTSPFESRKVMTREDSVHTLTEAAGALQGFLAE